MPLKPPILQRGELVGRLTSQFKHFSKQVNKIYSLNQLSTIKNVQLDPLQ